MSQSRAAEQRVGAAAFVHAPVPVAAGARDEIDAARADEYALLASLLLRPPDREMLARLSRLQDAETPLGRAHVGLAEAAMDASTETAEREYFDLFLGVGRGEIVPYASYYLTGFLNEKPLVRLRQDLASLNLERAEGHGDPEDHIGTLCEVMSGLASGRFGASAADQRAFFAAHVAPWAVRLFADLEQAEAGKFYKAVGSVGRLFLEIEAEGFAIEARQGA
jgi:TorA maturation chaperone TorD